MVFGVQLKPFQLAAYLVLAMLGFESAASAAGPSCFRIFTSTPSEWQRENKLAEDLFIVGNNQTISAEIYERFSVNEIARSIVKSVFEEEKKLGKPNGQNQRVAVDLRSGSDLLLFFHDDVLNSIEKYGFLNQHQTGTSNGLYKPMVRRTAEDDLLGIKMGDSSQAFKLRPKSAFLNIHADVVVGERMKRVELQYGKVAAVMKQEVKDRALWTTYCSLDSGYQVSAEKGISPQALTRLRGTFDSQWIPTTSYYRGNDQAFYEALIYGEIGPQDVDYFLVSSRWYAKDLKKFKKPIYLLKPQKKYNRVIYEKGALLYSGMDTAPLYEKVLSWF